MAKYRVHGGGWYVYCYNDKTKIGRWGIDGNKVKGERDLLTAEEADEVIADNEARYMKMGNVFKERVEDGEER